MENHTYIYAEGWVCLRCEKDPKGIPVVEPGEIRFRHDGETIKEAAKKKSIHKESFSLQSKVKNIKQLKWMNFSVIFK